MRTLRANDGANAERLRPLSEHRKRWPIPTAQIVANPALGAGEVALGGYLLAIPAAALSTLALFIGFRLLFRSLSTISHAFALRRLGVSGWGWGLGSGLLGGLFGLLVLLNPGLGALGASLWLALALLVLGAARGRPGVSPAQRRPRAAQA